MKVVVTCHEHNPVIPHYQTPTGKRPRTNTFPAGKRKGFSYLNIHHWLLNKNGTMFDEAVNMIDRTLQQASWGSGAIGGASSGGSNSGLTVGTITVAGSSGHSFGYGGGGGAASMSFRVMKPNETVSVYNRVKDVTLRFAAITP